MKNWIVLLLAIFSFASISAQHCETDLIIDANNEKGLTVKIDGRMYKLDRHTTVIRGVRPGKHNIKIFKRNRRGIRGYKQGVQLVSRGRLEVVPCSKIYANIDHRKGLHIEAVKFYGGHGNHGGQGNGSHGGNGHNGHNGHSNYGYSDHYNNSQWNCGNGAGYDDYIGYGDTGNATPPPTYGNHSAQDSYGGYDYPNGNPDYSYDPYPRQISEERFNGFSRQLKDVTFESTRKNQAISIIKNNNLNSAQMRKLLNLFDFESTRLEIAKFGFKNVTDPENYRQVFDAFSFTSSVDEMLKFMN